MSLQIFLNGKLLGTTEFLRNANGDFEGRAQWLTLQTEQLPRQLLEEFGLSKLLLGASGGGEFLLVVPQEYRDRAAAFCANASQQLSERSGGVLRLIWAFTEVLGDWSDIRRRLKIDLEEAAATPAANAGAQLFTQTPTTQVEPFATRYSRADIGNDIPFADHTAPNDEGTGPASLNTLATRASGRWAWGVLRGEVDGYEERLLRANTVEEHLHLKHLYQNFLINELQMRCSEGDYWQRVHILYASRSSFAVVGAWDALIGLARDMQRIFGVFVDANLRDLAGNEGRTISMGIALATDDAATLEGVWEEAGEKLELAQLAGRDSIWVLGRVLDWKQLADAADSRQTMTRLIREYGASRQFLDELAAFYADSEASATIVGRRTNTRVDKPWRFYRRLNSVLAPTGRGKDYGRLRSDLISDFTGRRASVVRLRPQGRVALEWARLETE